MAEHRVFSGDIELTEAVADRAAALAQRLRADRARAVAFTGDDPVALLAAARAAFDTGVAFVPAGRHAEAVTPHVTHTCTDSDDLHRTRHAGAADLADVAFVCATSGTSGRPNLVPWTRSAVAYQVEATAARLGYVPEDRVALLMPLGSAYGLSLVAMWLHGRLDVVLPTALGPNTVCAEATRVGVAGIEAPPAWWGLVNRIRRWNRIPASARVLACGGDKLPVDLARSCLAATGRPLLDGYGLTEAGPNVAVSGPDAWRLGSVGRPLDGTAVMVDQDGVLRVRGPGLATGYLAATAPDDPGAGPHWDGGWLVTGDRAEIDQDGFLTITGRASTRLKIRGELVHPEQVEQRLHQAEAVVDVAVTTRSVGGVEELTAFVVAEDRRGLEDRCRRLARGLPLPSRPRSYRFVPELPRNANGKLDRLALRTLTETEGGTRS